MKKKPEGVKAVKKPVPVVPTDYKMLQELKHMNETLIEIKDILDNMWRDRRPS
uniref:Uncharacterized protein n=1 Tax=viral metagenome TaxID=1070528 RepID=A0A6M3XT19_9ZZZZ